MPAELIPHTHFLRPSSLGRVSQCSGSVQLQDTSDPNPYATKGTRAHLVIERILRDRSTQIVLEKLKPEKLFGKPTEGEVKRALPGLLDIDEAMGRASYLAICEFFKNVRDVLATNGEDVVQCVVKTELPLSVRVATAVNMSGTADLVIISPAGRLYVLDYKHGEGVAVSAENNAQLEAYLYMAWKYVESLGFELKEGVTGIIQPRHAQEQESQAYYTPDKVKAIGRELKRIGKRVAAPKPEFKTGAHCKWCPSLGSCMKVRESLLQLRDEHNIGIADANLSGHELGERLRLLTVVSEHLGNVKAAATEFLLDGGHIEGFRLGDSSRASMTDPFGLAQHLIDNGCTEEQVYKKREVQSISNLKKAAKAAGTEVPNEYIQAGQPRAIVVESNSRVRSYPMPNITPAQQVASQFENLNETKENQS